MVHWFCTNLDLDPNASHGGEKAIFCMHFLSEHTLQLAYLMIEDVLNLSIRDKIFIALALT